jgi:hypothetical protein
MLVSRGEPVAHRDLIGAYPRLGALIRQTPRTAERIVDPANDNDWHQPKSSLMASWTEFRHSLLNRVFAAGRMGPVRRLILRRWADRDPDDFERWCHETGRDPDVLRAQAGARYRSSRPRRR